MEANKSQSNYYGIYFIIQLNHILTYKTTVLLQEAKSNIYQ